MPTTAPERSVQQRLDALDRANRVRTARAAWKRAVAAGEPVERCRQPVTLLLDGPPVEFETMKVYDLLCALPKVGRVMTSKVLRQVGVSPVKTLGGLTPRQRTELVVALGPWLNYTVTVRKKAAA